MAATAQGNISRLADLDKLHDHFRGERVDLFCRSIALQNLKIL
jgi:hypothetical protein